MTTTKSSESIDRERWDWIMLWCKVFKDTVTYSRRLTMLQPPQVQCTSRDRPYLALPPSVHPPRRLQNLIPHSSKFVYVQLGKQS